VASTGDRPNLRALTIGAGMMTLAAWLIFWWLAVPRYEICPAIHPAPAGCHSGRVPVAVFWTVVTGALYGLTLLLATLRPDRRWWFAALLGLFLAALRGWYSVLYA
jgi:hypothetical protein